MVTVEKTVCAKSEVENAIEKSVGLCQQLMTGKSQWPQAPFFLSLQSLMDTDLAPNLAHHAIH